MRILSVTQFSMHHCVKAGARHMISGGRGGSIIVVGSIMADFSHPSSSTYTSSKCAVKKLGEVMSRELAPHGIRVNVVQPGHIATANEVACMDAATRYLAIVLAISQLKVTLQCSWHPGVNLNQPALHSISAREVHGRRMPLGRMGTGADIGSAVAFLCSAQASYSALHQLTHFDPFLSDVSATLAIAASRCQLLARRCRLTEATPQR
jgi:NAD(P)-dependent dehydrogenase (short-subunit alcohol dehydrogenase family)